MFNVLCPIIAYLLGSLQTSLLLVKFFKFPDPRTQGSGNTGATNVLRTAGKNKALITLIGDLLKGFVAVLIAKMLGVTGFFLAFTALAAVIGHIFPIFFQFRGGKGVATAIGGLLLLSFWISLFLIIIWLVVVFITRYISLASIITAALAPFFMLIVNVNYFVPLLIMSLLIIWKHTENIQRLRKGVERKIKLS